MSEKITCTCGLRFPRTGPKSHLRHMEANPGSDHNNAEWLLGHLIVRGFDEDKPRIAQLRKLLGKE